MSPHLLSLVDFLMSVFFIHHSLELPLTSQSTGDLQGCRVYLQLGPQPSWNISSGEFPWTGRYLPFFRARCFEDFHCCRDLSLMARAFAQQGDQEYKTIEPAAFVHPFHLVHPSDLVDSFLVGPPHAKVYRSNLGVFGIDQCVAARRLLRAGFTASSRRR